MFRVLHQKLGEATIYLMGAAGAAVQMAALQVLPVEVAAAASSTC